jgi:hypothetical protein
VNDPSLLTTGTPSPITNEDYVRFEQVECGHSRERYHLKVIDPVFVNPNTVSNIALILRHIGITCGLKWYGGNKRSWLFVCCDGLPFGMVQLAISDFFHCDTCILDFVGKEARDSHLISSKAAACNIIREFNWVVPIIGDGH